MKKEAIVVLNSLIQYCLGFLAKIGVKLVFSETFFDDVLIQHESQNFGDPKLYLINEACLKTTDYFKNRTIKLQIPSYKVIVGGYLVGESALHQTPSGQTLINSTVFTRVSYLRNAGLKNIFFTNKAATDEGLKTAVSFVNVLNVNFNNYYHWVVDCLLLLQVLEKYEKEHNDKPLIIVPQNLEPKFLAFFDIFNISRSRLYFWKGGKVSVEKLIVTSPVRTSCLPDHNIDVLSTSGLNWLKSSIRDYFKSQGELKKYPKNIFISRQKGLTRRVHNYDEFKGLLDKFGFVEVYLEELEIYDQLQHFIHAEIVLAPHGAGLVNCVVSDNATIIEMISKDAHFMNFTDYLKISQQTGNQYIGLFCDPIGNESADAKNGTHLNSDILVDIKILNQILNSIEVFN